MKFSLPPLPTPARRVLLALLLSGTAATAAQAQNNVGIGTNAANPAPSAVLDLSSTSQGLLAPRMSQAQRNAIGAPATGLLVYQTDNTPGFYVYTGSAWTAVAGSGTQGPIGPQGPIGNTGAAGTNGAPGAAGPQGPIGNTGAAGAPGAAGTNGAPGAAGPQGPIGNTGAAGTNGAPGVAGTNGTNGAPGVAGTNGTNGAPGAAGTNGTNGTNGQGVPTGGTAGQVLSKIDGTNYNTQWTTPTGGSGTFPSIELSVANNVQQTISSLFNSSNFTTLTLSGTNAGTLTGGNTWNGTTLTVGSTGAGWYQVTSNFVGVASGSNGVVTIGYQVALDKNGAFAGTGTATAGTYPLAFTTYDSSTSSSLLKNHSLIQTVVFLAAGDNLNFRAQSWSTVNAANTSTDGSSNVQIVRLR